MMRLAKAAGVSMLSAAVLMGGAAHGGARATDPAVALAVPGRRNANASIAASQAFVAIVWGASTQSGETEIVSAVSRDGGRTFGAPVRVDAGTAEIRLSGEQPPRVALVARTGREPAIVAVWTARGGSGTRLLTTRSDDGGHSFSRPAVVPGSAAAGNRGWESMAVDRAGHVIVAWLDHRGLVDTSTAMAQMKHAPMHQMTMPADGAATAQRSKLYVAGLSGAIQPQPVAAGVCYCCKTALATGPDGAIYAAWREVYPGNIRDIAFTRSTDAGRTFAAPVRVSDDHWVLNGCPENGPALAVGRHDVVHILWPTLVSGSASADEPTLALFYAATNDGHHFSARQRIQTEGIPRHAWLASGADGELLAAWDESLNGTRRVVFAEATPTGLREPEWKRVAVSGSTNDEYPVAAAVDGGFVAAWTSGPSARSTIRVQRIAVAGSRTATGQ